MSTAKTKIVKECLEKYMSEFIEHCRSCGQKMSVHGFRKKTEKWEKALSASCTNQECHEKWKEVSYREAEGSGMRCEACREKITILQSRERNGCRGAVYGMCLNEECRKRKRMICYLGPQVQLVRPSYAQKQVITKETVRASRIAHPKRGALVGV